MLRPNFFNVFAISVCKTLFYLFWLYLMLG